MVLVTSTSEQSTARKRAPRKVRTGYAIERELTAGGAVVIAGIDEVGRGSWAGPVMVGVAVTRAGFPRPPTGLTDSKLLTARRREEIAARLPGWLAAHATGQASPEEIDELGMTAALRLAATRALDCLPVRPDVVLLDGKHDFIGAPWTVRTAIKADLRSVSVAAASVIAKVTRDRLMAELGTGYPEFAFEDNAGYPAPVHKKALAELGPTPHHRLSWVFMDNLPQWRHLKKFRTVVEEQVADEQLTLLS
jgi:ribonuclease HII